MSNQILEKNYATIEKRHLSPHVRKCIDGSVTGSNKCVAYCNYEMHPGYLTEKLRNKHNCLEKKCKYYLPKQSPKTKEKPLLCETNKQLISIAAIETSNFEGLRIMRAEKSNSGYWIIYYVAIAEYALSKIEKIISEQIGIAVSLTKLPYRYEIAAKLIFGLDPIHL